MPISYDKLWKLLIDKKMNRTDLKDASGISFNVLAKMGKNEFVSMESLMKICATLNCNVGDGIEKKATSQESIFYIQAILNHWLMELLVKSRASTFRGDYYSHGKQFIATLPIFKIDFENPAEVAKHQQIVEMVQNIMQLKEQLAFAPNAARRTVLEHSITAINAELNSAIDELYQVESQEVEEQV